MRRYTIDVDGKSFSLDVTLVAPDRFEVLLGERKLAVTLVEGLEIPLASITPEQEDALAVPDAAPAVAPPGPTQSGAAVAPVVVPLARPGVANTARSGPGALNAPMPGVITRIEVRPGDTVKRGQSLFALEAMKMVNAIRAPRDGVVAEVLVAVGNTVAFGDPLLRFER